VPRSPRLLTSASPTLVNLNDVAAYAHRYDDVTQRPTTLMDSCRFGQICPKSICLVRADSIFCSSRTSQRSLIPLTRPKMHQDRAVAFHMDRTCVLSKTSHRRHSRASQGISAGGYALHTTVSSIYAHFSGRIRDLLECIRDQLTATLLLLTVNTRLCAFLVFPIIFSTRRQSQTYLSYEEHGHLRK
jgi:hypothetical protein